MASFLSRVDAWMNWGTMIAAASAFLVLVGGEKSGIAIAATAVATLFSVTQITLQTGKLTTSHEGWHRRWRALQADIQNNETPSPTKMKAWLTKIGSIEQEFPHENIALRWDCRNEAIRSLGLDDADMRKIGWLQKRLIYILPFQSSFEKRLKLKAPKGA